jgi:hypothetical protein
MPGVRLLINISLFSHGIQVLITSSVAGIIVGWGELGMRTGNGQEIISENHGKNQMMSMLLLLLSLSHTFFFIFHTLLGS